MICIAISAICFFNHWIALSFSYSLKKKRTGLFFGKCAGSQGEDLVVKPKRFFVILLAISILYFFWDMICLSSTNKLLQLYTRDHKYFCVKFNYNFCTPSLESQQIFNFFKIRIWKASHSCVWCVLVFYNSSNRRFLSENWPTIKMGFLFFKTLGSEMFRWFVVSNFLGFSGRQRNVSMYEKVLQRHIL